MDTIEEYLAAMDLLTENVVSHKGWYLVNELPEPVRRKVIDSNRDINVDFSDWEEYTKEYWVDKLDQVGFTNAIITCGGFYSQGSGSVFHSSVDVCKWIKSQKMGKEFLSILRIEKSWILHYYIVGTTHQYSHEYSAKVEYEIDYWSDDKVRQERIYELAKKLRNSIEEHRVELCREIHSDLQKEYERLIDDEAVVEALMANDVPFSINGVLLTVIDGVIHEH